MAVILPSHHTEPTPLSAYRYLIISELHGQDAFNKICRTRSFAAPQSLGRIPEMGPGIGRE